MAYKIEAPLKGYEFVQELTILLVIKNRFIIILVNRKEGEFKYTKKGTELKLTLCLSN
jgi:hypothetical protein